MLLQRMHQRPRPLHGALALGMTKENVRFEKMDRALGMHSARGVDAKHGVGSDAEGLAQTQHS
jgi:hypothetical protein